MFHLIGRCRPVFVAMTVLAFLMSMPLDHALAALVATQSVNAGLDADAARTRLLSLLSREEVRVALLRHGIDPAEAEARAQALTDNESAQLADAVDGLPAGGMDVFLALFLTGVAVGLIVALLIAGGIWAGVKLTEKNEAAALSTPPAPALPRARAPVINAAEPWTGKWKVTQGQMAGTWAFKQTGESVVSTDASDYAVDAKVRGATIVGTWYDKLGKGHGALTAVIAEDGLSFNGDSQHWPRAFFTAVKVADEGSSAAASTPLVPAPQGTVAAEPWTGKWKVESGKVGGMWILKQGGDRVTSAAESDYIVEARVSGNVISGTWSEKVGPYRSTADFKATLSEDGLSFQATGTRLSFTAVKLE